MIIDLTEKFNKLRKENENIRNERFHSEYLEKYYKVRKVISKSPLNILLRSEYQNVFDLHEESDWCEVITLAGDLYEAEFELYDYFENLLKKINQDMVNQSGQIDESRKDSFDDESILYAKVLLEVDRLAMIVARFRENFIDRVTCSTFAFSTYLDYIVTSDYLKITLIEDFIMQNGHFSED